MKHQAFPRVGIVVNKGLNGIVKVSGSVGCLLKKPGIPGRQAPGQFARSTGRSFRRRRSALRNTLALHFIHQFAVNLTLV
jgi:hypothetical protein